MVIDLKVVAEVMGVVLAIGSPILVIINKINKLLKRLSALESWTKKQQVDIETGSEERQVLLTGTLACLKGLQEQGCDGPVTKAIENIEEFIWKQAHQGISERR